MTTSKPAGRPEFEPDSLFPLIQGIRVDLTALASICHGCRPDRCDSAVFCCGCYEVGISEAEMQRIVGVMPLASEHARHLRTGNGYRNVFDEIEPDLLLLDTDDSDLCFFTYRSKGARLCSLHTVALNLDRKPVDIKPQACSLWPLAIADTTPPTLSVQNDAARFSCNRFRKLPSRRLDAGVEEILAMVFGAEFLEAVRTALSESSSLTRP